MIKHAEMLSMDRNEPYRMYIQVFAPNRKELAVGQHGRTYRQPGAKIHGSCISFRSRNRSTGWLLSPLLPSVAPLTQKIAQAFATSTFLKHEWGTCDSLYAGVWPA